MTLVMRKRRSQGLGQARVLDQIRRLSLRLAARKDPDPVPDVDRGPLNRSTRSIRMKRERSIAVVRVGVEIRIGIESIEDPVEIGVGRGIEVKIGVVIGRSNR
jgi:hypothetical protein